MFLHCKRFCTSRSDTKKRLTKHGGAFCYTVAMMKNYLKTNPRQDRRSKYGNLKTEYNGTIFMSKKEAQYATLLDSLKKASKFSERVVCYQMQVPFQVELNGKKICKYLLDFKVVYGDGRVEHVDVKGVRTGVYRIKKKLVEAQFGIEIIEV